MTLTEAPGSYVDLDSQSQRLVSLDVFRGLTIVGMIVVNTPGSAEYVYPSFAHAEWHGWTFADLIFPSFLFIVGVALTLTLAHRRRQGVRPRSILVRTLRRTFLLFVLGLFLTNFPSYDFATLRLPGILQRIAVCYGLATLVALTTTVRGQAMVTVGLLAFYWILLRFVPVPGFGVGGLRELHCTLFYVWQPRSADVTSSRRSGVKGLESNTTLRLSAVFLSASSAKAEIKIILA